MLILFRAGRPPTLRPAPPSYIVGSILAANAANYAGFAGYSGW